MDFGYFIKYADDDYDVIVDRDIPYSGYNVVSKERFSRGKYNLADVAAYTQAHPEMELPQWPAIQPTYDELCIQINAEQYSRIEAVRWRVDRYDDAIRQGLTPKEAIEPILQYIQAVREVNNQEGFPNTVIWPEVPAED